ncbi:MAG: 50S ribosomal protein L22 [archaeon]
MVKRKYNYEIKDEKKIAKAILSNARCSLKYSTEFARELKGMKVSRAEKFFQNVIDKKEFLPLRRYNKKVAHRKGRSISFTKSGRYPKNTAKIMLKLLESAKANADYKGLNSENLLIIHFFASKGFSRVSHQSKGHISGKRRKRKSTHLEIVVAEGK